MDTKSKILLAVVLLSIAFSVYFTHKRAFIERDFEYYDSSSEVDNE
jgi:hypothetical protein